ncbi:helix-turn-helix domain-containing protein [Streptomyces sp. NPDC050418]|uniref:helix-turn-helix domain-containing protein n=1 Tax=Streptomyces sp. NPDC050418 TaxID=3365612 RepID=UPI0037B670B3
MTQSPASLPGPDERRRLREANGLTQTQVAEEVGVTRETVRSWEAGRTSPRGRTREAYAELVAGWRAASADGRAKDGRTSATDGRTKEERPGGEVDRTPRPTPALLAKFAKRRVSAEAEAAPTPMATTPTPTPDPMPRPKPKPKPKPAPPPTPTPSPPKPAAPAAPAPKPAPAVFAAASVRPGVVARTPVPETPREPAPAKAEPPKVAASADPAPAAAPPASTSPAPSSPSPAPHGGSVRVHRPSETAKAVEHLMPVKPVEPAAHGELSQSAVSADGTALPQPGGRVDLVKEKRKGRKGARTRPKAAAKRAAKPAGTGPARDEHSGVPRTEHEHRGGARSGQQPVPSGGDGSGGGSGSGGGNGSREGAAPTAVLDETPGGHPDGTPDRTPDGPPDGSPAAGERQGLTPAQAFDALYAFTAPGLVRQTYLLTGRRALAKESVERAFHKAWERWPEVAKDRDPVGWVRAAAYEYALSPWHRLRRGHRHPDAPPAEPEDRKLLDTLLSLPPSYRRTLVLYDGVGLDLPETAAETEASTPAAANRLVHAREVIAERLPELSDPGELQRRLEELASAEKLGTGRPTAVRGEGERRVRFWTRAAIAFTALIIGASAITWITSAKDYEPEQAPGQKVTGVPPRPGPQTLDHQEKELRKKLRLDPGAGPERIHPLPG